MSTTPSIGTCVDLYLLELERLVAVGEYKPETLENYQGRAKNQIASLRDRPIGDVTITELREWHLAEAERVRTGGHHSATTGRVSANLALKLLHLVMLRAEADGVIPRGSDPTKYVRRFQSPSRTRFLTEEELAAVWEAIARLEKKVVRHAKRPKALAYSVFQVFRLILLLGLRRNEALLLRWEHVDLSERMLRLPSTKTGYREVALSDEALQVLQEQQARRVSDWVFPSRVHGKPVRFVYDAWRRVMEISGIDRTGVVLHTARHSLATCALRRGEAIEHVSLLLGHSSTKVTRQVYARPLATPGMRGVVERQGRAVRRVA